MAFIPFLQTWKLRLRGEKQFTQTHQERKEGRDMGLEPDPGILGQAPLLRAPGLPDPPPTSAFC